MLGSAMASEVSVTDRPVPTAFRRSGTVVALAAVTGGMAATAAAVGLFWPVEGNVEWVTSVRGERVELYGQGLYRYDSTLKAAANRGTDVVTLVLGMPALVLSVRAYRRGVVAGGIGLLGVFTWLLYVYASMALGTAFNELFLVYVVLFGTSLAGLAATVASFDEERLADATAAAPHRPLSLLLGASGLVTAFVWLQPLLVATASGRAPELLAHSTTMVTDALDLAIVTPAVLGSAVLLRRRHRLAVLSAMPFVLLLVGLFPMIVVQSAFQLAAGHRFEGGELAGPLAGFAVLGAVAGGLAWTTMRRLADHGGTSGDQAFPRR